MFQVIIPYKPTPLIIEEYQTEKEAQQAVISLGNGKIEAYYQGVVKKIKRIKLLPIRQLPLLKINL